MGSKDIEASYISFAKGQDTGMHGDKQNRQDAYQCAHPRYPAELLPLVITT